MTDFINFSLFDLFDILLVSIILFQIYKLVRRTVAVPIFFGLGVALLFWYLFSTLQMEMLSSILQKFFEIGFIFFVIVFQQEIRRFLNILGSTTFSKSNPLLKPLFGRRNQEFQLSLERQKSIVNAVFSMAKTKTGALIILERRTDLDIFGSSGEPMDSLINEGVLKSIFFKNSPLHDGAIIIKRQRISATRVVLPYAEKEIQAKYGMRHRAAIGITEKQTV